MSIYSLIGWVAIIKPGSHECIARSDRHKDNNLAEGYWCFCLSSYLGSQLHGGVPKDPKATEQLSNLKACPLNKGSSYRRCWYFEALPSFFTSIVSAGADFG